jgi:hypothetical protein
LNIQFRRGWLCLRPNFIFLVARYYSMLELLDGELPQSPSYRKVSMACSPRRLRTAFVKETQIKEHFLRKDPWNIGLLLFLHPKSLKSTNEKSSIANIFRKFHQCIARRPRSIEVRLKNGVERQEARGLTGRFDTGCSCFL